MINVYATDTNYNEDLATGNLEMTIEEWMKSGDVSIDELVDIEGDELVFHVAWGNDEGHDEFRVTFS